MFRNINVTHRDTWLANRKLATNLQPELGGFQQVRQRLIYCA